MDEVYRKFCVERFPLPSEAQLAELEDRLGVRLPWEYRRFVLSYNGGFFSEPDIVPPENGCPVDRLASLNGIGATDAANELGSDTNLFDDNDPAQILPIGYTVMGNLLFMVTDPDDEMPGWIGLKIAYRDQSFWLADSITDFFALIREEKVDS